MSLPLDRIVMPAPIPSHPNMKPIPNASIRSQSVPTLLRPTGQYQFVVPPRLTQTPPPVKNVITKADIKAAIALIDPVLLTALGNSRDRVFLMKMETDVQRFLRNPHMTRLDFPPMSSYQRLMAHRIAEYYHLEHTAVDIDTARRVVVLFKTLGSRCPDVQLMNIPEEDAQQAAANFPCPSSSSPPSAEIIAEKLEKPTEVVSEKEEQEEFEEFTPYEPDPDMPPLLIAEPPKQFKILRRRTSPSPESSLANLSLESNGESSCFDLPSRNSSSSNLERTLEERERDYALARARIFQDENSDAGPNEDVAPTEPEDAGSSSSTKSVLPSSPAHLDSIRTPSATPPIQSTQEFSGAIEENASESSQTSSSRGRFQPSPHNRSFVGSPSYHANHSLGRRSPGQMSPGPSFTTYGNGDQYYWHGDPSGGPHPQDVYNWGAPMRTPPHQTGLFIPDTPEGLWNSTACYPGYNDGQWYPYYNSRQAPVYVPNTMSPQYISDPFAPGVYPHMQPSYPSRGPMPNHMPGMPKGRGGPNYPLPVLPGAKTRMNSQPNVPTFGSTSSGSTSGHNV